MGKVGAGTGMVRQGMGSCIGVWAGELRQLALLGSVWGLQPHSTPWDSRYQNCHSSTAGCQMCTAQLGTV